MQNPKANQEAVILIHGLMRSHKSMQRLEWYLSKKGYEIHAYNYPSTKYTITGEAGIRGKITYKNYHRLNIGYLCSGFLFLLISCSFLELLSWMA